MKENYSEFNPHIISCGTIPIEICPPANQPYGLRIVKWYELELILESDQGYVVTEGKKISAQKGVLYIRKPGMLVQGVARYGCHKIIFDSCFSLQRLKEYEEPVYGDPAPSLLKEMKSNPFSLIDDMPNAIQVGDFDKYYSLYEQCIQVFLRNDMYSQFYGKQIVYTILMEIEKEIRLEKQAVLSEVEQNIEAIKQYIQAYSNTEITLKKLANLAGYSRETLCRLFKKHTKQTPIDYLIKTRIVKAKELILKTAMPINAIAIQCGFNNDTYFYRQFKKYEKVTPNEYRRMHHEKSMK